MESAISTGYSQCIVQSVQSTVTYAAVRVRTGETQRTPRILQKHMVFVSIASAFRSWTPYPCYHCRNQSLWPRIIAASHSALALAIRFRAKKAIRVFSITRRIINRPKIRDLTLCEVMQIIASLISVGKMVSKPQRRARKPLWYGRFLQCC